MGVKILIADDHAILRKGVVSLVEKQPGMQVVGEAEDGMEAVSLARKLCPDVIVMDISMPKLNGIDATAQITRDLPIKVIILSMHENEMFIERAFRSGASGYLLKECTFNELIQAINEVACGNKYLSPAISSTVLKKYLSGESAAKARKRGNELTPKERRVLQLLSEGYSTKDVGRILGISVKTAETHRQHIMEKLGLHSIAELTKYALRQGLTTL